MDKTIIRVQPWVMIVRDSVLVIALLMTSGTVALRILRKFSRIRSAITTDSFTEYPSTASTAASTGSENSHWKNAKKPRMITTSWRLATIAETANRHSKRIAR